MEGKYLEKFKVAGDVLFAFFLDGLLVSGFVMITLGVQKVIEYAYGEDIENIENLALYTVFAASKVILIALFMIYGATHIAIELKKAYKEVRHD